jgi:5-methyltetrahydropteroyltriglutamate--homocysteine methyltransferase
MIPPFRADHVGSLLRPGSLKAARAKHAAGEMDAKELAAVEDKEIAEIIRQQESIGLHSITDGEFRRSWWNYDFIWSLDGCVRLNVVRQNTFRGVQVRPTGSAVTGRLGFPSDHPMLGHFKFLQGHTKRLAKMTIPSPAVLHFRTGRAHIDKTVYPDLDGFFDDLVATYISAIKAFYDVGCRYLQLDDTIWAYLCSEDERRKARERGDDVDALPASYARVINAILATKPSDMVITTHVCRGNFRSSWISEGGYEPVADILFGSVAYDGFFLEYDTDRAGGFEPLRFVPKGKRRVVLGLVTSKSGEIEEKQDIIRRIEEAARYVDLDQLALSPQCGFASTEEGNILAEEEQWAKLALVVDIAREVWGQ